MCLAQCMLQLGLETPILNLFHREKELYTLVYGKFPETLHNLIEDSRRCYFISDNESWLVRGVLTCLSKTSYSHCSNKQSV